MSAPAEICDACGKTITDEELETGAGISVLGKSYCPACKGQAMQDISLEDLAAPVARPLPPPPPPPKAAPKLPPPPKPEARADRSKTPPPAATPRSPAKPPARVDRPREAPASETPKTILKPATRRVTLAVRKGPNPLVLVGIGVAVALAAVGIFAMTRGEGGAAPKDPRSKPDPADPAPKKTPLDPEAARRDKAEQTWLRLQLLSRQPGITSAELIEAADRAKAECAGTPFEAKLEEFRAESARTKTSAESLRVLEPLIAELRTACPADAGFARYAELSDKYQKAKELAVSFAPDRVPDLNRIRQDYVERYEEKARPYLEEIEQTAKVLADERRYDDAIAKIETFPRELRLSGAWKGLESLRQDIERRKKLFPPKK